MGFLKIDIHFLIVNATTNMYNNGRSLNYNKRKSYFYFYKILAKNEKPKSQEKIEVGVKSNLFLIL